MGSKGSFIEFNNVSFTYPGGYRGLQGVSFAVEKGEYLMVLGANGSGKSTLAKMVVGLLLPGEGEVFVDGLPVSASDPGSIWEVRRKVGWLTQNPDYHMVAPLVEEDVAFGPENYNLPTEEIRRRVDWALQVTGMEKLRNMPVHQISGGEQQKAALAGLLALEPECLVLDEPSAMLDRASRKEILDVIHELHRRGTTVLHITHDTEGICRAGKALVLHEGKAVLHGSPDDFLAQGEKLNTWGLEVPPLIHLALTLSELNKIHLCEAGIPLASLTTPEGLVKALCP